MKTTFVMMSLISTTALADVIKCNYTEPFFDTTYSMAQQSLTIKSFEAPTKVIRNVSFQIKGPGEFILMGKDGKVLQTLTLNFKGSDGMSDRTYPFEGKMENQKDMANNGIGGCTSNFLKATEDTGSN